MRSIYEKVIYEKNFATQKPGSSKGMICEATLRKNQEEQSMF